MSLPKVPHPSYQYHAPAGINDLRGYVFMDEDHARKWMAQKSVNGYAAPVIVLRWSIGETVAAKVRRDYTRPHLYGPQYIGARDHGKKP